MPPRIYADFNNTAPQGHVRLNCAGTSQDLARQGIQLQPGLSLTLYDHDLSEDMKSIDLEVTGVVEYSEGERCWIAVVDWSAIRHVERNASLPVATARRLSPQTDTAQRKLSIPLSTKKMFTATIKGEIRRLARKEIRVQVTATKRAAAQHRRDISRLKREIKAQEKRMGLLISQVQENATSPADDIDNARFSPRSVRAQRRRLGFSAEDYGKLVGVSGQTIYHWEQGKARPRKSQLIGFIAVRGISKRAALLRLSGTTRKKRRITQR